MTTDPTRLAGEVSDENNRLIGRYVYFQDGNDQELLDKFFKSWLETYDRNEDFFITLDLETTGLKPHEGKILLVSISWDGRNSIIFCPEYYNLDLFKQVLNTIPINNQNIKFDLKWLAYHYGTESRVYMDTMVCTQLGWPGVFPSMPQGTFGLGNIAKNLLSGYKLEKETRKEFIGMTLEKGFTRRQIEYAVKDSLITHKLVAPISVRLKNQGLWEMWETIEKPLIEVLVRTELKGVKVNTQEVQRLLTEKEKELAAIYDKITQELTTAIPANKMPKFPKGVFNPGSSQQIVNVLNVLGIKVMNTEKGTLQSAQAKYQNNLLGLIIEWKKTKGIISKFLTKWLTEHIDPLTECIFTSFNTYGAETGRLSCKEPNMQQIPGDLRSMIIAREGYKILSMDYSQFEFRAAAAITEEEYLVSSFVERSRLLPSVKNLALGYNFVDPDAFVKAVTKGKVNITDLQKQLVNEFALTDIHRRNAALILSKSVADVSDKERSVGKTLGYAVLYGAGANRVQESLAKEGFYHSLNECKEFLDEFFNKLPKVEQFIKETHAKVLNPGYISTVMGRKRFFELPPKYLTRQYATQSEAAFREATNFCFQGANADATKKAMVVIDEAFRKYPEEVRPVLLLTVHDEVVAEVHHSNIDEVSELGQKIMVECGMESINYKTPVEVSQSIGDTWSK